MTQPFPSTIKADKRLPLWADISGPSGLWSTVTKSTRELSWVLANKFALMAANAAVMLFLANRLDLTTYGLLVITISGQLLISRLLLVGVDAGMIRLTGIQELRPRYQEVVSAGLAVILCTSAALIVISLMTLPVFFMIGVHFWVIASIVVGSIGLALVDYAYSFRLAQHEYWLAAITQGGTALWRFGLTAAAAVMLVTLPAVVFLAYHVASLISGFVHGLVIAKTNWRRPDKALIRRLLHYSFWLGKANVIVILSLYQGTFLLIIFKHPAETGIFGLGLSLSLAFFAIYNAYSEYLAVRVRSLTHTKEIPRFLKRGLAVALVLIFICVPVVFVIATLVPLLLGTEWRGVVPIFVYLSAAMMLLIFQAPLIAVCHYLLRPHLITVGWVMCAASIFIFGLILTPRMGATGAAIAQLIGTALALLFLSWLVSRALGSAMEVEGDS